MNKEENLHEKLKQELIEEIIECNSTHKNCDFLLEHFDCDILTEIFEENKCLKEEYVMLQNASDEVEDGLRENYNKTLSMLVETELLPCDCFEDYFNCCECDYCNKECSNGDKNCWKNFIENYYKNKQ